LVATLPRFGIGNSPATLRAEQRTAAIDGKSVATLRLPVRCRVLGLDAQQASPAQVKQRLSEQYGSDACPSARSSRS
jgi:hypothetical protein